MVLDKDLQSIQEVRDLMKNAKTVQKKLSKYSQSQIDEIWEEEPDAYRKQRIGRYAIKNIRERLERRYKEDFILEIKSEVGKGTTVILELPCEEK